MAITLNDVHWGSYLDYEGPWSRGVWPAAAADETSSLAEKTVAVVTATEGSAYDAVNMYDRCIMTVGLIQFCDAGQFSVAAMLGAVADAAPNALTALNQHVATRGYRLQKTPRGVYRFVGPDGEVDTVTAQRTLYLLSSDGHRGSWDDASRDWARKFVVAMASVWDDAAARAAQLEFTYRNLPTFVFGPGLALFRDDTATTFGLAQNQLEAARAAYVSFAANMPAVASHQFDLWQKTAIDQHITGLDFLVGMLRTLTFGPKIAIYPGRYDKIAPVLTALWGVAIPAKSSDLGAPSPTDIDKLKDVTTLQRALVALGFDLGPRGVDGVVGPKTRTAIIQFQSQNGLTPDGVVGATTAEAILAALQAKGVTDVV